MNKADKFRGDPDFEAMGIFKRVTAPRVKAAITGVRHDGVKLTRRYKWAEQRPLAAGFDENVEFFELQDLDPDDVSLGDQFKAIHPLLWLAAGGKGRRDDSVKPKDFYIAPSSAYAVLFDLA